MKISHRVVFRINGIILIIFLGLTINLMGFSIFQSKASLSMLKVTKVSTMLRGRQIQCSPTALFSSIAKKAIFLGTPDCAAKSLEIFQAKSNGIIDIVAVVTQPPAPSGRNMKLTMSPVHILANSYNISVLSPESAKDVEFLSKLEEMKPDLCITAAYGNFLPRRFLDIPKYGTINIHPSLLPKYRGAAPIQRCLENGDEETGVSVVFTVLKMDAGPIIRQLAHKLNGNEKAPDLLVDMFIKGTLEAIACLPQVFDGTSSPTSQNEQLATSAAKLSVNESRIDFSASNALQVHNKVRAFAGWPGTWSSFIVGDNNEEELRLKIITTEVIQSKPDHSKVGLRDISIIKSGKKDILGVTCGDGSVLGITEVQPQSKKVMAVKDFLNGLRGKTLSWTIPPI